MLCMEHSGTWKRSGSWKCNCESTLEKNDKKLQVDTFHFAPWKDQAAHPLGIHFQVNET